LLRWEAGPRSLIPLIIIIISNQLKSFSFFLIKQNDFYQMSQKTVATSKDTSLAVEGLLAIRCGGATFRSGARKDSLNRPKEPNEARRSRGKLSLIQYDSTIAWRLEQTPTKKLTSKQNL